MSNPNAFDLPMTSVSATESGRGRRSIGPIGSSPEHATEDSRAAVAHATGSNCFDMSSLRTDGGVPMPTFGAEIDNGVAGRSPAGQSVLAPIRTVPISG